MASASLPRLRRCCRRSVPSCSPSAKRPVGFRSSLVRSRTRTTASSSARLRSAVALIEPALILFFAVLVGFVALAMLQAIYSVNAGTALASNMIPVTPATWARSFA